MAAVATGRKGGGEVSCEASLLSAVPLFAAVSADTRQAVAEAATVRLYRRNMFVFAEGDPAERFYFVLDGRVRVFRDTPDGHEQTLQVLERGGLLALVCLVPEQTYPASAQTMQDSHVGSLPTPDLARLVRAHGDLAWTMMQQLARRLLWAQGRIYDLALRSATGRVVSALVQFARQQGTHGSQADGVITVDLPLTHRELGQLTGVSRETVTRTLRLLRDAGAVRWTEDGLLVLHLAKLQQWLHA